MRHTLSSPASAATPVDRPATTSRTLTAAPLRALEQRWQEDLKRLVQWTDPATAAVLSRALGELREALEQGERQETVLSIKEIGRRYDMATSTLTWICRRHGTEVGARKVRGEWYCDRAAFEAFHQRSARGAA